MISALFAALFGIFKHKDVAIAFVPRPITQETIKEAQKNFTKGEKIYFIIASKKKIKDNYIRIQIVKKDEKSEFWGYSIEKTMDAYIGDNKHYYTDYIVMLNKGYYIMQVFTFKNLSKPIVMGDFWVDDN